MIREVPNLAVIKSADQQMFRKLNEQVLEDFILVYSSLDTFKVGWRKNRPLRVRLTADDVSWIYDDDLVHLLEKNDISQG